MKLIGPRIYRNCRASSLVELTTGMTALVIFSWMGTQVVSSILVSSRNTKLSNDVRHINAAIHLFRANGGSTDGINGPEAILQKLKASRGEEDRRRFVGVGTGPLIDARLFAVILPEDEVRSKGLRALWDQRSFQFKLSSEEVAGVKEFAIREEAPGEAIVLENGERSGLFSYSEESTWIWDYVEAPVVYGPGPTDFTVGAPATPLVPESVPGPKPNRPEAPPVVAVNAPVKEKETGGIAVNLGSGSATAADGFALNLLSANTTAEEGELAVGVLGVGVSAGGKKPLLSFGRPASLTPGDFTGTVVDTLEGAGSGSTSAVNGITANLGSGDSTAVDGISANVGEGSSTANQGVAGNLGSGKAAATNGLGLNLGTGSATAGGSSDR